MHYLIRIYNNYKLYGIFLTINRIFFFIFINLLSVLKNKKNLDEIHLKKNQSLNYYFNFFNCDKGSKVYPPYHFSLSKQKFSNLGPMYEKYLNKFRKKKISILEIGVYRGKSMATFLKFFAKSKYYGIDTMSHLNEFTSKRSFLFEANSTKFHVRHFRNIKFDFIIDDGSHIKNEVIQNFKKFSNLLKKNGFYFIEDIDVAQYYNKSGENNYKNWMNKLKKNKKFKLKFYKNKINNNSVLIVAKNA